MLFLMAGLLIYYLIPGRFQWECLLVLSAVFLCAADWRNLLYIAAVTGISFAAALRIEKQYSEESLPETGETSERRQIRKAEKAKRARKAKHAAVTAVVLLVLILVFSKYVPEALGLDLSKVNKALQERWLLLKLITPFGLSYYLLMAISYVLDVYWKRDRAEHNFLHLCLFISYFPLLTQGPISRYSQLREEFFREHGSAYDNLKAGALLILWGFFKKMVIADRIGVFVRRGWSGRQYGLNVVICLIFYGIYLYGDFSGGIDVIRGISECFGVKVTENFRQPYFSKSLGEFWRRWHISLGAFMKDYVFFPLALWKPFKVLKKKTKKHMSSRAAGRVAAAVMDLIVFLIVGVWHGMGSQYAGWGLYNGVILAFSTLMEERYAVWKTSLHIEESSGRYQVFRLVRTLLIVTIGWVFDCKDSAREAIAMFFRAFLLGRTDLTRIFPETSEAAFYLPILVAACLFLFWGDLQHEKGISLREKFAGQSYFRQVCVWTFLFQAILLFGRTVGAGGFMYANF